MSVYSQSGFSVRLEVGRCGAAEIAPGCDVAVVVDVLGFTTTLTVAADRGVPVAPCPGGTTAPGSWPVVTTPRSPSDARRPALAR
jgi:hypothetical protein